MYAEVNPTPQQWRMETLWEDFPTYSAVLPAPTGSLNASQALAYMNSTPQLYRCNKMIDEEAESVFSRPSALY